MLEDANWIQTRLKDIIERGRVIFFLLKLISSLGDFCENQEEQTHHFLSTNAALPSLEKVFVFVGLNP